MKKAIAIGTLVIAGIAQTSTVKADASKEENIGVASGAVVGAAAGGPVGFIIGAAIGGLLGDQVEKAGQVDELETELSQVKTQESQLKQQLHQLETELATKETKTNLEGSEMLQMDFMFATRATALDDMDRNRIDQLAGFLQRYPSLSVKLDGFADPRGDEQANQALSEQRIESVKQLLIEQGINEERILTTAHGEANSIAPQGDLDAYALERRVSIRFFPQSEPRLASKE